MTVHNFIESFQLGEVRKIPSNCTFKDLAYYAATRFNYCMRLVANNEIKRVCLTCGR